MKLKGLVCTLGLLLGNFASADLSPPPESPKHPVVDAYQGVKVSDDYRWLEETSNPQVKAWTEAQNAYAHAYLDQLPALASIRDKLEQWNSFHAPSYRAVVYRAGTYFFVKMQPPKNQPLIVALTTLGDTSSERVVLDPNQLDPTGGTSFDFFAPSLDGKLVAVSLAKKGSEIGTLHIYETLTGKELSDTITPVNKPTAGGSVAWNRNGDGFYYTRYPHEGERPAADLDFFQQIYFHKLGDSVDHDAYALGKDFPRIAEIHLSTSQDGRYVLATVANGDGGEFALYLHGPEDKWTKITAFEDKVIKGVLGLHDDLYLLSRKNSPKGKILRLSLAGPEPKLSQAKLLVKESDGVIEEVVPTATRLYVVDEVGGPSRARIFSLSDKGAVRLPELKTPPVSNVSPLVRTEGDQILYKLEGYTRPAAWFSFDGKQSVQNTALDTKSPVDFSDIEVVRETARSKDGASVPISILYKKGVKRDGKNPALLYGYGGYGISMVPRFNSDLHLWLEHGGVYAVANLRGGGEFGESWHRAGNLLNKQHVFDDFISCAEHLIKRKYTARGKLAIEGGSNGGLLMGAVLTQRPDLFSAVVSHVGIYDMLRVETDPNGAFNVTEFGTVKDPAQFKALYAYSPLHHVKDGVIYPPTLLMTGANDGRVNPYHSKKMAARLQAVNGTHAPVLLRVAFDGGHGIGRSVTQKVNEEADAFAFFFAQLGLK